MTNVNMGLIHSFLLLSLVIFHALAMPRSDHPCNRECQVNVTMTCEYQFTVENYLTLSKACYHCPWNTTDCFRPHCISTNGAKRPVLAINRQIPGPSIEVCKGDTVRLMVENKMEDGSAVSIHVHGITQDYTNYMDGVPQLTQCNILPSETFRYEFLANNSGTHWYHSHTGFQLGDGLHGAFIVREPVSEEVHSALYNGDTGDHVMLLTDWEYKPKVTRYMEEVHDVWAWPVRDISITVNGRGRLHLVEDVHNITKSGATVPTYTPYEVFRVVSGQRYRFRMISAATRCFFKVMIDNHNVTVIATDGAPIKSVEVGVIIIHPGERYDFVVSASAAPNDYWIKILGLGDCGPSGGNHAILHYEGYQGDADMIPSANKDDYERTDRVLNPNPNDDVTNRILQSELRSEPGDEDMDYTTERVDVRKYIELRYLANDNSIYNNADLYSVSSRLGMITPTMNNITMKLPPIPLSTQWSDLKDSTQFCNADTLDTTQCDDNLCYCFHIQHVQLGQVVELFLVGLLGDPHQFHLHGYLFRVVGTGVISSDSSAFGTTRMEDIIARDQNLTNGFPRTLINPLRKDTVTVPARGGYAIIRFKADNPGMWFFHCHNEGHLMQGMAMVIKVGDPAQFPRPKFFVPECGGYHYRGGICNSDISMATTYRVPTLTCLALVALAIFLV